MYRLQARKECAIEFSCFFFRIYTIWICCSHFHWLHFSSLKMISRLLSEKLSLLAQCQICLSLPRDQTITFLNIVDGNYFIGAKQFIEKRIILVPACYGSWKNKERSFGKSMGIYLFFFFSSNSMGSYTLLLRYWYPARSPSLI